MAKSTFVTPGVMQTSQGSTEIPAGTGSAFAGVGGVLTVNTTQAGTTAVTTEEDLWTYSLPANTLSANGKAVRITAFGTTAANANNKTIKLYFGSTVVATSGTSGYNGIAWTLTVPVIRTGAATQLGMGGVAVVGGSLGNSWSAPAETLSGAITIKVTGQNGTASANDIVFRGAIVEYLSPPV